MGDLRLRQRVGMEESGEVGREVGGEESSTAVPGVTQQSTRWNQTSG